MRKLLLILFGLLGMSGASRAQSEPMQLTTAELSSLYAASARKSTSIHDPSVVWDSKSGYYYLYGSHRGRAKTKDFKTYTSVGNIFSGLTLAYDQWGGEYITTTAPFKENAIKTVTRTLDGVTETVDFGTYDAAAWCASYASDEVDWVSGDMWAPDIIYNPHMGKWCYYLSLNGDHHSSVIILMTSDNIEGPYVYQAPIVFGGFTKATSGAHSYKNTDLEIVLGPQPSLPSRYDLDVKSYAVDTSWPSRWTNVIDPCVFFDEEGELWMSYGSWFGGIFMLKLDKNTGLRDYTYTYDGVNNNSSAVTSDPYFGLKIAGGYQVSGEGSYIQHIGSYYYLFMSYGGFAPNGGYEMRVFRSENPTGPYKDAASKPAIYTAGAINYGKNANDNRGMKLIGAMNNWGLMTVGECAQGHNSVCQDEQGRTFLVCHTKFNDGTIGHSVRVYQLYLNKQGWLCTAPFQFDGEGNTDETIATTQPWSAADIEGDYHVLIHPYRLDCDNMQEATPGTIHLSADGAVTGDYTGTWKYTDEGKSYFQIKLGSYTYNGVVVEQTLEGNTSKVLCFTAVSTAGTNCGVPVWGYKLQPAYAISRNYQLYGSTYLKSGLFTSVSKNITICFDPVENVRLSWTSSMPDVLSNDGKYNAPDEQQKFTMTARMECGDYFWENEYNATAKAATAVTGDPTSGVVAYYSFDETPVSNLFNEAQTAELRRSSTSATYPVLETNYARFGQVLHQAFGAIGYNSYTRMPNPLAGQEDLDGFTVSLWVKRADATNPWDALWSFFSGTTAKATGPRLYFTGNSYLGFNDNAGHWFDVNYPVTNDLHASGQYKIVDRIDAGTWRLITVTYSKENGYTFYRDGSKYMASNMVYAGSESKDLFDRDLVLNFVKSATYFYLGLGSFWGSAEACFDDLLIYNRELSSDDVKGLNTLLNRVNPFSEGTIVGVEPLAAPPSAPAVVRKGIYDLMGNPVQHPSKGLYVVDGKPVFIP